MSKHSAPAPDYEFRHRIPVQIRFNDIDMFGHVNNTAYLQYFDLGKASYFAMLTGGRLDKMSIGLVIVNISCDFYAQTFMHEKIEVLTAVHAISQRSLVLEQRVVSASDGEVKSVCRTVMAAFDPAAGTGAEISDDWRRMISKFEERVF